MRRLFIGTLVIISGSLDAMNASLQATLNSQLHHAIFRKNVDLAHQLLHKGAQTDSKDTFGLSPLHLAVMTRSLTMVRLLLLFNAPLNAQDVLGNTALDVAKKIESSELVDFLSKQQSAALFIHYASVTPSQKKPQPSNPIRPFSPPADSLSITNFFNVQSEDDDALIDLKTGQITLPNNQ